MSDHNNATMTTPVRQILNHLRRCPIRARIADTVTELTGDSRYRGRHRTTNDSPARRTAQRLSDEWNKPRAWTTAIGHRIAHSFTDQQADKLYDMLTGETFREAARTIGTTWRTIDRAAYGTLPATWRHRLETSARQRAERAQRIDDTEEWWLGRRDDYPVLVDTQALPIIRERTTSR